MRWSLVLAVLAMVATGCTGYVWGDNSDGQLGDGTTTGTFTVPTAEASGSDWFVLTAGERHTCGVKQDRTLWCWGRNRYGTIGNGAGGFGTAPETSPVQVGTGANWQILEGSLAGGLTHTCAIDLTKRLWCWGENSDGQLGDGTVTDRFTPVQVGTATDWTMVTAAGRHTCGIRNTDELYCWGRNSLYQLGLGDTGDRINPTRVTGSWEHVDAGTGHTCGITTAGELKCWGSNSAGQIGISRGAHPSSFRAVIPTDPAGANAPDQLWLTVSAGGSHTCGIVDAVGETPVSGALVCTGSNAAGQLGFGTVGGDVDNLGFIAAASGWSAVSAGGGHTCAIKSQDMFCWGDNDEGQLGNGNPLTTGLPTGVALSGDWTSVSAGARHTVGLRNEN